MIVPWMGVSIRFNPPVWSSRRSSPGPGEAMDGLSCREPAGRYEKFARSGVLPQQALLSKSGPVDFRLAEGSRTSDETFVGYPRPLTHLWRRKLPGVRRMNKPPGFNPDVYKQNRERKLLWLVRNQHYRSGASRLRRSLRVVEGRSLTLTMPRGNRNVSPRSPSQ